jgi:hypothetical protein
LHVEAFKGSDRIDLPAKLIDVSGLVRAIRAGARSLFACHASRLELRLRHFPQAPAFAMPRLQVLGSSAGRSKKPRDACAD